MSTVAKKFQEINGKKGKILITREELKKLTQRNTKNIGQPQTHANTITSKCINEVKPRTKIILSKQKNKRIKKSEVKTDINLQEKKNKAQV